MHAFGLAADMDPILQLAKKHGIAVVEDAACALGSRYKGIRCGAIGDIGCFSFHPRKSITTGEGGMITTDNDLLAEKISILRNHGGIRRGGRFTFEDAGFNYRLSEIHGAMGVQQMGKLDWILSRRRELAVLLSDQLKNIEVIAPPMQPDYAQHTFQSYVVLLHENIDRDKMIEHMYEKGIETTIGTYALHIQPFFTSKYDNNPGAIANSYVAYKSSLTLPLYAEMNDAEVEFIVNTLKEIIMDDPTEG